jgi:hypothetical protein
MLCAIRCLAAARTRRHRRSPCPRLSAHAAQPSRGTARRAAAQGERGRALAARKSSTCRFFLVRADISESGPNNCADGQLPRTRLHTVAEMHNDLEYSAAPADRMRGSRRPGDPGRREAGFGVVVRTADIFIRRELHLVGGVVGVGDVTPGRPHPRPARPDRPRSRALPRSSRDRSSRSNAVPARRAWGTRTRRAGSSHPPRPPAWPFSALCANRCSRALH